MLNRRNLLAVLGAGLATVALSPRSSAAQHDTDHRPPNIIFWLADDAGWGDLGCYGNREIHTPNLDRLAREGSLFTQFYVSAAVCSPSRASIITGRFNARLHILAPLTADPAVNTRCGDRDFLDPAIPNTMRQLKQAGYVTAHYGKWHLGPTPDSPPLTSYGIDEYKTSGRRETDPTHKLDLQQPGPRHTIEVSALITDQAIRFLDAHKDRPFCLNLWTMTPHVPLYPTEKQMEPYRQFHAGRGIPWPGAKQVYYAAVTEMDRQIGRVLGRLDELNLTNNTIFLFTSDNGPENIYLNDAGWSGVGSAGPFRGHKGDNYEGGIREPFIVRWPGHVPAGRIEETAVVGAVDLFPTLCGLAGAALSPEIMRGVDGEDLSDIFLGASQPRTKDLYWKNAFYYYESTGDSVINKSPQLAIRQGDWKLLVNPDGSRVELYDLKKDLSEVDNQADGNPRLVKELSQKLMAWEQSLPAGEKVCPANGGAYTYPWPKSPPGKTVTRQEK